MIGLIGRGDEAGWREPRRDEVESSAEVEGRFMERQSPDGRPEIEGIALGAAGEAAVALADEMDGEGSA